MVEIATTIEPIVNRYCRELARLHVRVSKVFLFGSYSRGTATEDSDIDLIIVSPDFAAMGLLERLETLGVAAARVFEPIEAYGVTPEEVENGQLSPFWAQMLEEAVPVEV